MTILQTMRQAIAGGRQLVPVADLLGFRLTAIEPGRTTVTLDTRAAHTNPMGAVHGGVLGAIADTAMGLAYGSTLDEGESFTTIELKINFLRPVRLTSLVAEGTVVHRGRRMGLAECTITDSTGRLVAKATSTCMTVPPAGSGQPDMGA